MPIAITCPACNSKLKAPDDLAGRGLKCPRCKAPLKVPAGPSSPSGSAAPPAKARPARRPAQEVAPDDLAPIEPSEADCQSCPFCGEEVRVGAKKCKSCGETLDVALRAGEEAKREARRARRAADRDEGDLVLPNNAGMVLGMIGAAVLGIGLLAPVVGVGGIGANFVQLCTLPAAGPGRAVGVAILLGIGVVIILSFVAAAMRFYWPMMFLGLAAVGLVATPAVLALLALKAAGNEQAMAGVIQSMQWGWAVLLVGALLILVAGFMSPTTSIERE
jgi:hypothetical protein